ncbi:DUF3224 domain-containing protein [Brevundimonas sp. M20]|uniref:DUF3224 domain-containing protein n=1 Tax=Brevundimonas sp. M20 TaxID=2591463 RepID=UPI00143D5EEC|nr:DUF3224 domain-containing protein [Brevundimonas sp. M20]
MLASILAAVSLAIAPQEAPVSHQASGTFTVSITPVPPAEGAAADLHGRMTLSKTFHGGLTGTGEGEMLGSMGPNQSGAYVAMERVRGALDGHEGTFLLVHRGIMDRGAQDLSITVVPGSGTGALEGLVGVFHLTIADGEHRYVLDYTLPAE